MNFNVLKTKALSKNQMRAIKGGWNLRLQIANRYCEMWCK